uniref:Deleted in azoospermia-like n=1 Tax=Kryptolebias marmoratus TaxID=37003 RepID=A0A3Q3B988_KRYMA
MLMSYTNKIIYIFHILFKDFNKPRSFNETVPSLKLSNGYILPEGKLTPNALFVGGIDIKVDENEMRDFFARYGAVKEVKIITYRGGICKGYGFVYFSEDVNIQSIIEQQISFKGRKLKLGPAIMKERTSRSVPSRLVGPTPWMSPTQYIYCACCSPMGGGVTQPSPILSGGSPYNQVPHTQASKSFLRVRRCFCEFVLILLVFCCSQNFVDCGVQTMLTVL